MLDTIFHYQRERQYRLHEFVVMPDHFHLLVTLDRGISIEKAVQFVKGGFSFRVKKQLGYNWEVWQRGFSETRLLDAVAYVGCRNYIWDNPVNRGLVSAPEDYLYSSARAGFVLDSPPEHLRG